MRVRVVTISKVFLRGLATVFIAAGSPRSHCIIREYSRNCALMNPNFLSRKRLSRPAAMAFVGGVLLFGLTLTVLTLGLLPAGLLHPLPKGAMLRDGGGRLPEMAKGTAITGNLAYEPRAVPDSGGFKTVISSVSWSPEASLT